MSTRRTQFPYFNELLGRPVWKGRKILDFGGNIGTFLESAGESVDHADYWCVDINPAVVTKLADRGSSQTIGLVTDVGLFLYRLVQNLQDAGVASDMRR